MPDLPDSSANQAFTREELMAYPEIPLSTACKLAQEGRISGRKAGRHWRIRSTAIDRCLEEHSPEPREE